MAQQRRKTRNLVQRHTSSRNKPFNAINKKEKSDIRLPKPQRPAIDDYDAWRIYWQTQNQPWRTEPEINIEHQEELKNYLRFSSEIKGYAYPFEGKKLDRADMEWLVAIYEDEHRPVDRLNICGANLRYADLHGLPLTRLQGGIVLSELMDKLTGKPFSLLEPELQESLLSQLTDTMIIQIIELAETMQVDTMVAQLEGVNLSGAQLRGANLVGTHLEGANLSGAQLEGANLSGAQLEGINLSGIHLEGANLSGAQLKGAILVGAQLKGAILVGAQLKGAILSGAQLMGANLSEASFFEANLSEAWLQKTDLNNAQLVRANLSGAQLTSANLSEANLQGANLNNAQLVRANLNSAILADASLNNAQLVRANLNDARLEGANLCGAQLKGADLTDVKFCYYGRIGPQLADVHWDDINLFLADWPIPKKLGDENKASYRRRIDGKKKDKNTRLEEYRVAARAYRQLAVALQTQGLNEDAARFAHRAQRLQRIVLRRRHKFVSYLFSGFLDLIAGYGYRPGRAVTWYLLVIVGFAAAYSVFGHLPFFPDALVFSLMSFHGRGFFPSLSGETSLHNQIVEIAAAEAVVGLLIEISFIATFTQRFFGK